MELRADVAPESNVTWYCVTVTVLTWWVADMVTVLVAKVPVVDSGVLEPESHL